LGSCKRIANNHPSISARLIASAALPSSLRNRCA